ncbi:MAG: hypothetical protein SPI34_08110 [Opitutales bacterium]|nr:hypothetical protein [Opitutales bacterium]
MKKSPPIWALYLADALQILAVLLIVFSYTANGEVIPLSTAALCMLMTAIAAATSLVPFFLDYKSSKFRSNAESLKKDAKIEEAFNILFKETSSVKSAQTATAANLQETFSQLCELKNQLAEKSVSLKKCASEIKELTDRLSLLEENATQGNDDELQVLRDELTEKIDALSGDVDSALARLDMVDEKISSDEKHLESASQSALQANTKTDELADKANILSDKTNELSGRADELSSKAAEYESKLKTLSERLGYIENRIDETEYDEDESEGEVEKHGREDNDIIQAQTEQDADKGALPEELSGVLKKAISNSQKNSTKSFIDKMLDKSAADAEAKEENKKPDEGENPEDDHGIESFPESDEDDESNGGILPVFGKDAVEINQNIDDFSFLNDNNGHKKSDKSIIEDILNLPVNAEPDFEEEKENTEAVDKKPEGEKAQKEGPQTMLFDDLPPAEKKPKKAKEGKTCLIVNALVGIGNKPYVRKNGERKGVPMQFLEIGKWQYAPENFDEPARLSVWLNDSVMANEGDILVNPSEQLEINATFKNA